jgi:site-specific DNA-adenine methylase
VPPVVGAGLAHAADDHRDLRDLAVRLKLQGVHVLLSNAATPAVRELYEIGFQLDEVQARRNINCQARGRGAVGEYIIR